MVFIQQLNELFINIKFTFELETEERLPFLHVELTRVKSELILSVYRKPTANLNIIPFDARTPLSYNLSTFSLLINRGFNVSSGINLETRSNSKTTQYSKFLDHMI